MSFKFPAEGFGYFTPRFVRANWNCFLCRETIFPERSGCGGSGVVGRCGSTARCRCRAGRFFYLRNRCLRRRLSDCHRLPVKQLNFPGRTVFTGNQGLGMKKRKDFFTDSDFWYCRDGDGICRRRKTLAEFVSQIDRSLLRLHDCRGW